MFGLFKKKSEADKLQAEYEKLMEEARNIQRSGDMKAFALKTAEAEAVMDRIVAMRKA
ncbi:MAG: Lacal_2735 family protein [Catalinimonas sp.]